MNPEAPSEYEFRKALTNVQPGDHLCLIHASREELCAAVIPLLQAGLERGERCIYVADEDPAEELRRFLGKERRTLDLALESGRLQLLTKEEAYLHGGRFEPETVIGFWRETAFRAKSEGFTGVRLFGEVSCNSIEADMVGGILEYEVGLNALARECSAVVVCLYDRTGCSPEILLNALRTHPFVIYGEVVSRNPHYIPAEEFHASERAGVEVERLLTNLREREQAQMRLRETQERFAAFMDHLPAFAWIKDLEGRYVYMNAMMRALPNYAGTALGMKDNDVWPPETAANFRANDARVIDARDALQTIEPFGTGEEQRYALSTKFPIFDHADRLVFIGGTSVEITQRIRAEQALRESEERFRQLAENIHEIFWIQNVETGQLEYVSRAFEHIWKRDREEVMRNPKAWMESIHPDDYEAVAREQERPDAERTHDHHYRIVWPDGTVRWIRDRAFPVKDASGRLTRIVGLAEDVTEATLNEQALRKVNERLQMLSRRMYEVQERERRHLARELHDEVGQALTAAKLNLKAAGSTADPGTAGLLCETTAILDGLLGKVREISLNLRPSLLDDLGLVPALRSLLDQQTRRGGLAPHFTAAGVPEVLDPETQTACFRIAQEALTNVLRHAQARAVSLELRVADEELHLTITDNGIGFLTRPLEENERMAKNFGLIGIKERAELAGGLALILSSPGTGTMVDVRLPLARPSIAEEAAS